MKYSPKNHKFAVIQSGYCVFGTGRTVEAAKLDAVKWMEFERCLKHDSPHCVECGDDTYTVSQGHGTLADLEACLVGPSDRVDGSIFVEDDPDEIRQYMANWLT